MNNKKGKFIPSMKKLGVGDFAYFPADSNYSGIWEAAQRLGIKVKTRTTNQGRKVTRVE